jgi:hypothetical protein
MTKNILHQKYLFVIFLVYTKIWLKYNVCYNYYIPKILAKDMMFVIIIIFQRYD